MKIENPDIIQKAGLIQFFEISFELSGNLMKEYLEELGFTELRSPRDTIRKAFEFQLIIRMDIAGCTRFKTGI